MSMQVMTYCTPLVSCRISRQLIGHWINTLLSRAAQLYTIRESYTLSCGFFFDDVRSNTSAQHFPRSSSLWLHIAHIHLKQSPADFFSLRWGCGFVFDPDQVRNFIGNGCVECPWPIPGKDGGTAASHHQWPSEWYGGSSSYTRAHTHARTRTHTT